VHASEVCKSANAFATLSVGKEGSVQVYKLNDKNEIVGRWTPPYSGSRACAISVSKGKFPRLIVACVSFAVYVFDIKKGKLSRWNERAGVPMKMPSDISSRHDVPFCIRTHPGDSSLLFLVSGWCERFILRENVIALRITFVASRLVTLARSTTHTSLRPP